MKIEIVKVQATKRVIGPKWGYEALPPLRPTHGIDIMREIECQISRLGPLKWKRYDDEGAILRRLFG